MVQGPQHFGVIRVSIQIIWAKRGKFLVARINKETLGEVKKVLSGIDSK